MTINIEPLGSRALFLRGHLAAKDTPQLLRELEVQDASGIHLDDLAADGEEALRRVGSWAVEHERIVYVFARGEERETLKRELAHAPGLEFIPLDPAE